jgi:hypothetical protein
MDVWSGKWVVVVLDDFKFERAFVAPAIKAAVDEVPDAASIGVDMPIGLPPTGGRRPADELARKFVGPQPGPSMAWERAPRRSGEVALNATVPCALCSNRSGGLAGQTFHSSAMTGQPIL